MTKTFSNYSKILVQINNRSKDTPDYIYFTIHGTATVSNPQGYLVIYGVKDWSDSVNPEVYDQEITNAMFQYENNKMKLNTDVNANNNKIIGYITDPSGFDDTSILSRGQIIAITNEVYLYQEIIFHGFTL